MIERVEALVEKAAEDPAQVVAEATQLEERAAASGDANSISAAMWARGHALRELGQMPKSAAVLGEAMENSSGDLTERIRTSLALTTFLGGDSAAALQQCELAIQRLSDPTHKTRAQIQKGIILARIGRLEEAISVLNSVDLDACDVATRALVLGNRGITAALLGRIAQAEEDLGATRDIAQSLGEVINESKARHNLAFVASLKGDLVKAISEYREVAELVSTTSYVADVESDLAEVLLDLGLIDEAIDTARRASLRFLQDGRVADAAEVELLLARALFTRGRFREAANIAESAAQRFSSQQRSGWKRFADAVTAWCSWVGQDSVLDEQDVADAVALARDLEEAGWTRASYRTLLNVGRAALRVGDEDKARRVLDSSTPLPDNQPPSAAVMRHHIDGLVRQIEGDTSGAFTRFDEGIAVVDRFRATLGATELRGLAANFSQDLAEDGLRLAMSQCDPDLVMEWMERDRAASLWHPPTRPPNDSRAVELLAQLRQVTTELTRAHLEGAPVDTLVRRRHRLEDTAAQAMWGLRGGVTSLTPPEPNAAVISSRLGDRTLVMFGTCLGKLFSVLQHQDDKIITDHGALEPITSEIRHVTMALRRLAAPGSAVGATHDLKRAAEYGLDHLDELIVGALPDVETQGLVIVPTGPLHRLPLSLLPSWWKQPITVTPSLGLWARAGSTPDGSNRAVFVSGPGLVHAKEEVTSLASAARERGVAEVVELVGEDATVDCVREMMDGADLIHIAAHGRFRDEHPALSSLQLADGGLTVHDLADLSVAPRHVVLSACDAGMHAVTGRDLTGLGATFLAAGTQSLVASLSPLPDDLAREAMTAFHSATASGLEPAAALAQALAETTEAHPLGFLTSSLTLMGSV